MKKTKMLETRNLISRDEFDKKLLGDVKKLLEKELLEFMDKERYIIQYRSLFLFLQGKSYADAFSSCKLLNNSAVCTCEVTGSHTRP